MGMKSEEGSSNSIHGWMNRIWYVFRAIFVLQGIFMRGRINRVGYFFGVLSTNAIYGISESIAHKLEFPSIDYMGGVLGFYILIFIIPKRFRDFNWSGWWTLPFLVVTQIFPAIVELAGLDDNARRFCLALSLIPSILLLFWPGSKGSNKFGSPSDRGLYKRAMLIRRQNFES